MEFDDLKNLIMGRRSIRRWEEADVPESMLKQAVELATWAPNAGNQQNWHFYIILNRDRIKTMADAVQASSDMLASWPETKPVGEAALKWCEYAAYFRNAPAIIAVAAAQYQSVVDKILAARETVDQQAGQMRKSRNTCNSRIQSVASAIAYLLLILHKMGLGAVWMTGPMQAKKEIEKILQVPSEMDIIAIIPVGYPAESPSPKDRRSIDEVCEFIR